MYKSCFKRILDLILSLAACVVLAIPMAAIAVWIKLDSPGPVFFKQRRVGAHKEHFNILKFRTMRGDTPHDVPTHLLKDADSYITKSGAFLRRTSLDELPQIYNIVAGQLPHRTSRLGAGQNFTRRPQSSADCKLNRLSAPKSYLLNPGSNFRFKAAQFRPQWLRKTFNDSVILVHLSFTSTLPLYSRQDELRTAPNKKHTSQSRCVRYMLVIRLSFGQSCGKTRLHL